jgi:hypothetical protein
MKSRKSRGRLVRFSSEFLENGEFLVGGEGLCGMPLEEGEKKENKAIVLLSMIRSECLWWEW